MTIDPDLWEASTKYVEEQLAIMGKYGSAPVLTEAQRQRLVYDCAKYPQQIRNGRVGAALGRRK